MMMNMLLKRTIKTVGFFIAGICLLNPKMNAHSSEVVSQKSQNYKINMDLELTQTIQNLIIVKSKELDFKDKINDCSMEPINLKINNFQHYTDQDIPIRFEKKLGYNFDLPICISDGPTHNISIVVSEYFVTGSIVHGQDGLKCFWGKVNLMTPQNVDVFTERFIFTDPLKIGA